MLYVVDVKENKRESFPPLLMWTARAGFKQWMRNAPRYYGLIEIFGKATGVPVLLNTSFNLKGEPIVNTPREAFRTFSISEMDVLVLDQY